MLAMRRLLAAIPFMVCAIAAQERGALLVATTASHDVDFSRTVVLVIEHDTQHTTGLMLNHPVKIPLPELLHAGKDQTAWAGGPILLGVNALLRAKTARRDAELVLPHVYLITDKQRMREEIAAGATMRVYLGMCGWGAGQLESEIRRGLWRVVPGSADAVFDGTPGTLWERLTRAP